MGTPLPDLGRIQSDPLYLASLGIHGSQAFYKFGARVLDNNGNFQDIWGVPVATHDLYPFPNSASTLDVVSSSAQDSSGGTGASTVRIIGLDASYAEVSETVQLNGVTPVTTAGEFLRVNRVYCVTPGATSTTDLNAGSISISSTATSDVLAMIYAAHGQTQQMIYTVPGGSTLLTSFGIFGCGKGDEMWFHVEGRNLGTCWRTLFDVYLYQQVVTIPSPFIAIPEKTDFKIQAQIVSGGGGLRVNASVQGVLLPVVL